MDVAEIDEADVSGVDHENKTIRWLLSKNLNKAIGYLISEARLAFTQLRKAFTKTLILQHFESKCYIRIKTDASGYAIDNGLRATRANGTHSLLFAKNDFGRDLT